MDDNNLSSYDLDEIGDIGFESLHTEIPNDISYFKNIEVENGATFNENIIVKDISVNNLFKTKSAIITDLSLNNLTFDNSIINTSDTENYLNINNGTIYVKDISCVDIINSNSIYSLINVFKDISNANLDISNSLTNNGKSILNDVSCNILDISNNLKVSGQTTLNSVDCSALNIVNSETKLSVNNEIININDKILINNDSIKINEDIDISNNDIFLRNMFINGNIVHNSDEYFSFLRMINILFKKYLHLPDLYSSGSSEKEFNLTEEYINNIRKIKNESYNLSDNIFLDNIPLKKWEEQNPHPLSYQDLYNYYDISLNDQHFYSPDISNIQINESKTVIKFKEIYVTNTQWQEDISNNGVYFCYDISNNNNLLKNTIRSNYKNEIYYEKKLEIDANYALIDKQPLPLNFVSSNHNIIFDYNYGYIKVYNEEMDFFNFNDLSDNIIHDYIYYDISNVIVEHIEEIYITDLPLLNEADISNILTEIIDKFKPEKIEDISSVSLSNDRELSQQNMKDIILYFRFNFLDIHELHRTIDNKIKIVDSKKLILTFYKYIGRTSTNQKNNYITTDISSINESDFNYDFKIKTNKTTLFGIDNSYNTLLYNNIAMGFKNVNKDYNSLVVGQYNNYVDYSNNLFTVGCGTSDISRDNAFNIDTSGNIEIKNKLYIYRTDDGVDDANIYKDRNYTVAIDNSNVSICGLLNCNDLTVTGNFSCISDKIFKKNIKSINNSCEILQKIIGVEYFWNEKAKSINNYLNNKKQYGLIAQDVEKIIPEIVMIHNNYKTIDYIKIIPFLIQSNNIIYNKSKNLEKKCKELTKENINLEKKYIGLEKKYIGLEKKLNILYELFDNFKNNII